MKLGEILKEDAHDFVTYKVSAPGVDHVYYGYATGDENIRDTFLKGSKRDYEPDRGDVRMVNYAGGIENLHFEPLDSFTNEEEAFADRNDKRAADSMSVTGPSMFPATIFQRVLKMDPNRVAKWKHMKNLNTMDARTAMETPGSVYNYQDVKALATDPAVKQQLSVDLNKMTYPEFKAKYFPGR